MGAQRKRRAARGLAPPDGGMDVRIRASVNTTRFDLRREPSLATIPARRLSLVARVIGMTKEGFHVILQTITLTA